jgi:hypothetical protein
MRTQAEPHSLSHRSTDSFWVKNPDTNIIGHQKFSQGSFLYGIVVKSGRIHIKWVSLSHTDMDPLCPLCRTWQFHLEISSPDPVSTSSTGNGTTDGLAAMPASALEALSMKPSKTGRSCSQRARGNPRTDIRDHYKSEVDTFTLYIYLVRLLSVNMSTFRGLGKSIRL